METYHVFIPGGVNSPESVVAGETAARQLIGMQSDASYVRMMIQRITGNAAKFADDAYFFAMDEGKCVSRLWYGFGLHKDAVGNFGNFCTMPAFQGRGIGSRQLEHWFAHLNARPAETKPLALFCTSAMSTIDRFYAKYGFRPAYNWEKGGPTYCPLGNSPETFEEFRKQYFEPCGGVHFVDGNVGWRHEIDCLLRFDRMAEGETFGLPSVESYEEAWLRTVEKPGCAKLECALNERGHAVGWAYTPAGGVREEYIHPNFR